MRWGDTAFRDSDQAGKGAPDIEMLAGVVRD